MPMRPDLYPDDWNEISLAIREAVDWECQVCGKACRRPGEPYDSQVNTLSVAHWFHDNLEPVTFVVACCLPCHLRHDAAVAPLRRIRNRIFRQRQAGQLDFAFPKGITP